MVSDDLRKQTVGTIGPDDVSYNYSGGSKSYTVTVNGIGDVYVTKDERDARMFIAELKVKLYR